MENPATRDAEAAVYLEQRCGVKLARDPQSGRWIATRLANYDEVRALEVAAKLGEPASDEDVGAALAKCAKLTGKYERDDDGDFELDAWLEKLRRYPGDVVLYVLDVWPDRYQWPKWRELKAQLDSACVFRRMIVPALLRGDDGKPAADTTEPPTPEERAAIKRALAKFKSRLVEPMQQPREQTYFERVLEKRRVADQLAAHGKGKEHG